MTTITLPSTFQPTHFELRLETNQRVHQSPFGGSEQVVDLLNDRWTATMTLAPGLRTSGAAVEAIIGQLRGMVNDIALWHFARPQPRGTMRGSPLINGAHSAGASTVSIKSAGAAATLLAGDMIKANGLLLMVASDCTADGSGNISVPIINRLRTALTDGMAVTWDRPTAPFRRVGTGSITYLPGSVYDSITLDFVEHV